MAPPKARDDTSSNIDSLMRILTYVACNISKYKAPPYPKVEEFKVVWRF